jgi:hypothetical protein
MTAHILPFPNLRRLCGAYALQRSEVGVTVHLPGIGFCGSDEAARFAADVILEAFERGLTVRQLKDLARDMREVSR